MHRRTDCPTQALPLSVLLAAWALDCRPLRLAELPATPPPEAPPRGPAHPPESPVPDGVPPKIHDPDPAQTPVVEDPPVHEPNPRLRSIHLPGAHSTLLH